MAGAYTVYIPRNYSHAEDNNIGTFCVVLSLQKKETEVDLFRRCVKVGDLKCNQLDMNTILLSSLLSLVLGSVLVVNGVLIHTDEIITKAHDVVNVANMHQLATVAELYYSNHDHYPLAHSGEELITLFEQEHYILNRPLDPAEFLYDARNNGQDYTLKLAER